MEDDPVRATVLYTLVEICRVHRVRIDTMLSAHGVASGHEMFLLSLWGEEGLTHAQLAAQLRVRPASITNILHRMEKADLVTREQDSEDLRVWHVYLTEKGRALRQSLRAVWMEAEEATTLGLSEEERIVLRRLLLQVYANIIDQV